MREKVKEDGKNPFARKGQKEASPQLLATCKKHLVQEDTNRQKLGGEIIGPGTATGKGRRGACGKVGGGNTKLQLIAAYSC